VEVRMMVPRAGELDGGSDSRPVRRRLDGEVSQRAEGFEVAIEHDTVLPPWLCGGPLVNLEGKAIGLNIARASRVTTYALPSRLVRRIFANLKPKAKLAAGTASENLFGASDVAAVRVPLNPRALPGPAGR